MTTLTKVLKTVMFCAVALTAVSMAKILPGFREQLVEVLNSDDYDRLQAPGDEKGGTTRILTGAYVNVMLPGQHPNTVKMSLYFRQSWNDRRLKYQTNAVDDDEEEGGSYSSVRWFAPGMLWLPDTYFRTAVEPVKSDHYVMKINKDGNVWYTQRIFAEVPLYRVNSQDEGSDEDTAKDFAISLTIESFGYTADVLTLEPMAHPINVDTQFGSMFGYTVTDTTSVDCSQNYTSASYTCLDLRINLRKQD